MCVKRSRVVRFFWISGSGEVGVSLFYRRIESFFLIVHLARESPHRDIQNPTNRVQLYELWGWRLARGPLGPLVWIQVVTDGLLGDASLFG